MLRAYKYRIYPTDEQKVLFAKTFGCCRFVYNWALNLKITAYKERKETLGNVYLTNLMKSELKAEHEWLSEVNSLADPTAFPPDRQWQISVPCAAWVERCHAWLRRNFSAPSAGEA